MSTDDHIKGIRKFTFSANFGAPKSKPQPEIIVPTFSLDELEAARASAYAEGEAAGRQAMLESIEKIAADASALVAEHTRDLFSQEAARHEQMKHDAAALAQTILQKIAPRVLRASPLEDIAAVINEYVTLCYNEPRIVIRVADILVDQVKELSSRICLEQGYLGKVVILGDPRLQNSDCRVEWADGGAERNEAHIQQELDHLISQYMEARRRAIDGLAVQQATASASAEEVTQVMEPLNG